MFSSKSVLNVNGKIFAMLVNGNLVVKLPKQRVVELVAADMGEPFNPGHGRVMKEWIAVPPGATDWIALAKEAYGFVASELKVHKRPLVPKQPK
jgi:TfoX/Sxy family transcriptional regulator of competence genes